MNDSETKTNTAPGPGAQAQARQRRQAEALRANLSRRKAQDRARANPADEPQSLEDEARDKPDQP